MIQLTNIINVTANLVFCFSSTTIFVGTYDTVQQIYGKTTGFNTKIPSSGASFFLNLKLYMLLQKYMMGVYCINNYSVFHLTTNTIT